MTESTLPCNPAKRIQRLHGVEVQYLTFRKFINLQAELLASQAGTDYEHGQLAAFREMKSYLELLETLVEVPNSRTSDIRRSG